MERCYPITRALMKVLREAERSGRPMVFSPTYEAIHGIGSARIASILAAKRGVDVELAYAVGSLHDFGRIVTGKQEAHALNGYQPVKSLLETMGIYSASEIEEIALAVRHHSRKAEVGSPLDEIAKDCDILDAYYFGMLPEREEYWRRCHALRKELELADRPG